MHLRHPPRGVPRYPGPDYDTLPCRFISKPAGRLPKRATETTSGWETGFRGLIRLNVAPYNFTERGTNFPEQRPITPGRLDKREISLGQFGTIRNSFYRKSKVPSPPPPPRAIPDRSSSFCRSVRQNPPFYVGRKNPRGEMRREEKFFLGRKVEIGPDLTENGNR